MIVFIDFETTGLDIIKDLPIQLGAIVVNNNLTVEMDFLSNIKVPEGTVISKVAYDIHGITVEELQKSNTPEQVLSQFYESIALPGYKLAGWNMGFDGAFLKKTSYDNGFKDQYDSLNHRHIDVQSIANYLSDMLILEPNGSMGEFLDYFNIERNKKHNALQDADITFQLYKKLRELKLGD